MVECGSMQRIGQQDPVILSERNDFGERHVPRGEPGKSSGESPLIGIPKPDWGLPHRGIAQVPTELPSNSVIFFLVPSLSFVGLRRILITAAFCWVKTGISFH